jgi:hypothetical protein
VAELEGAVRRLLLGEEMGPRGERITAGIPGHEGGA